MEIINNINQLENKLSENLTLFFIKDINDLDSKEIINDIYELYEEIELIVWNINFNNLEQQDYNFLNTYNIFKFPYLILFEHKKITKVMNNYKNINWLEYFMLGE